MAFKISGLDKLRRDLEQAGKAFESLDGEIATLRFNPADSSSVEAAIADMEQAVGGKLTPYLGNAIVAKLAADLKVKYRDQILDRAASARSQEEGDPLRQAKVDQNILRQIENTVTDLRRAKYNTFSRHIKKLARLLHSADLDEISRKLTEGVDLDAWLEAGHATKRGMGSASSIGPAKPNKSLAQSCS